MPVSARHLILNLLMAVEGGTLSAREVVAACNALRIQGNNARVALTRLNASGMLITTGRGTYRLGPQAAPLADEISGWRETTARVREWNGDWVAVHVGPAGRSDRAALRARGRALGLLGLAEFERGLFLRPDNLAGGVDVARERLGRLGLGAGATVFIARGLEPSRERQARALWDGAALTYGYRERAQALDAWREGASKLSLDAAARESFLLGDEAIHALIFDPWLPQPLVDTDARQTFVESVLQFDAAGRGIWQELLRAAREPAPRRHAMIQPPLESPP